MMIPKVRRQFYFSFFSDASDGAPYEYADYNAIAFVETFGLRACYFDPKEVHKPKVKELAKLLLATAGKRGQHDQLYLFGERGKYLISTSPSLLLYQPFNFEFDIKTASFSDPLDPVDPYDFYRTRPPEQLLRTALNGLGFYELYDKLAPLVAPIHELLTAEQSARRADSATPHFRLDQYRKSGKDVRSSTFSTYDRALDVLLVRAIEDKYINYSTITDLSTQGIVYSDKDEYNQWRRESRP